MVKKTGTSHRDIIHGKGAADLIETAREVQDNGTFTYVDRALPTGEIIKHYER